MQLPDELINIINEFSKPVTKGDWWKGSAMNRFYDTYNINEKILKRHYERPPFRSVKNPNAKITEKQHNIKFLKEKKYAMCYTFLYDIREKINKMKNGWSFKIPFCCNYHYRINEDCDGYDKIINGGVNFAYEDLSWGLESYTTYEFGRNPN